ncbi:MAG: hydrogenase formation protein HypD [Desulfobacterales bacterium]|nr:MAG: hydrogenase formation protein HypD [Desulfobacterales bacterium]
MKHASEYRDPTISRKLVKLIKARAKRPVRLMEVCGTHTMSIFRSGIRSLLPETVSLVSGPGCPVCVTDQSEIDAFIRLAREEDVILATFGDLMRVPGSDSSLQKERAAGRDVRMVYSTGDALELARTHPDRRVVFLGVGFETTAPTVAAAVLMAAGEGLENFSVFSAHKLVIPALFFLAGMPDIRIDGFLLPGHVSVIIGLDAYRPFHQASGLPCIVAGFESSDILGAVAGLLDAISTGKPVLANAYPRAVTAEGNARAMALLDKVFRPADAVWRGMGMISQSGLVIRDEYAAHDASRIFDIRLEAAAEPKGCKCGAVITGRITPPDCTLFKKRCTPATPVGPCMVSSEGTCAAYYRFCS